MESRIITNGRKYSIEVRRNGVWKVIKDFHSAPGDGGFGWYSPFETRFFWRAKRRLIFIRKAYIQDKMEEKWWTPIDIEHNIIKQD